MTLKSRKVELKYKMVTSKQIGNNDTIFRKKFLQIPIKENKRKWVGLLEEGWY